ncbi:hypothetical protein ACFLXX_04275 [Chloroflexota bacterium]
MPNIRKLFSQIDYTTPQQVLKCSSIFMLTEWEEFEHLDYEGKIVMDGRRVSEAREAKIYEGVYWWFYG